MSELGLTGPLAAYPSGKLWEVRLLFCVAATASAIAVACSSSVDGPTEAWCAEIQPFVDRDGSTQGSIEIVEITDENREQVQRESSEQRSRIAMLISSPPRIRDEVERMLLGDSATVEERESARDEVTSYYSERC